jgi:antitoxin (DNA-binding transcriptional repressor) of toxin-antitoxin stability system
MSASLWPFDDARKLRSHGAIRNRQVISPHDAPQACRRQRLISTDTLPSSESPAEGWVRPAAALVAALIVPVLFLVALAVPAAARSRLTSRAPTQAEYIAIKRAFFADHRQGHRHKGATIFEIRITRAGRPVARVVYVKSKRKGLSSSSSRSGRPGSYTDDWYERRTPSDWVPDEKVTRALRSKLKQLVEAEITFQGSGRDNISGSSPGNVSGNPYCHEAPSKQIDSVNFSFKVNWSAVYPTYDGSFLSTLRSLSGSGSHLFQELGGCINVLSSGQKLRKESCTATLSEWPVTDPVGRTYLTFTQFVDRHQNHRLLLHAPTPRVTPPDCGLPSLWSLSDDGPVTFFHSVLIPDAALAADGTTLVRNVGYDITVPCASPPARFQVRCKETMSWKGKVVFAGRRFDPNHLEFTTPPPGPLCPPVCEAFRARP